MLAPRVTAVVTPNIVRCTCGRIVYDGEVIRSRCVRVRTGEALCKCKRWVKVPLGQA